MNRPIEPIITSAGETEGDRFSRSENLREAFLVYAVVAGAWWAGIGVLNDRWGAHWAGNIARVLMGAAAVYTVAIGPRLHGDHWHTIGFADPAEARPRTPGAWVTTAGLALIALGLVWLGWDDLLIHATVRRAFPAAYRTFSAGWPMAAAVLAFSALIASGMVAVFVRRDNLGTAAHAAAIPGLVFLVAVLGSVLILERVHPDWTRLDRVRWTGTGSVTARIGFYVLWGAAQQWLLGGYFNTRLRKGIAPGRHGHVPAPLLVTFLTALGFAGLHAPSWSLVGITFVAGLVTGWLFQRDRSRNVFALGVLHGVIGALLSTLTALDMHVGP